MTDPTLTPDGKLVFDMGNNTFHEVPLGAISSWSTLLGVSHEEALALILSGSEPPAELDVAGGNGWTALYDNLIDKEIAAREVQAAMAIGVRSDSEVLAVPTRVLSAMGRFSPKVVVDQPEALMMNHQLSVTRALGKVEAPVTFDLSSLGDLLAQGDKAFIEVILPPVFRKSDDTMEA